MVAYDTQLKLICGISWDGMAVGSPILLQVYGILILLVKED